MFTPTEGLSSFKAAAGNRIPILNGNKKKEQARLQHLLFREKRQEFGLATKLFVA